MLIEDFSSDSLAVQAPVFRRIAYDMLMVLASRHKYGGLLVFLDEIDVLLSQEEYIQFASILRSIVEDTLAKNRMAFMVSGLSPSINRVDWMDGARNPFYKFFSEEPLGPLEPDETRMMITSIGAQMGVRFTEDALQFLIDEGGGHPFITRQLCSLAVHGVNLPAQLSKKNIVQATEEYLCSAGNYMAESLWRMASGGPPATEAELLIALAAQPCTEEELVPLSLPPEKRRARQFALRSLYDQSLLRQINSRWALMIPLFGKWIRRNL